jgi:cytochrome b subunit of formate dehydrogenase
MSKKEKVQIINRFSIFQRIEHVILLLSFTTLSVTGVPQKFIDYPIADAFIKFFGGIEIVRVIHHVAAVVFILEAVYHGVVIGYKLYVTSTRATMLPGLQDAKDGLQALAYNFGLGKSRPKMGRYSFDEKMEYWAMLWGWVVMSLTGFMLWNPIAVTRFLPGVAIPVAKAAHGAEAILAVLAILIWHFYNVHLRHFNKSMFTGKISRHEMEEDHGQEMAEIDAGTATRTASLAQIKKRSRIYYPIAAVVSLVMLFGIYKFVTLETTSVTTLPPAERIQIYERQTPTPIPSTPTPTP